MALPAWMAKEIALPALSKGAKLLMVLAPMVISVMIGLWLHGELKTEKAQKAIAIQSLHQSNAAYANQVAVNQQLQQQYGLSEQVVAEVAKSSATTQKALAANKADIQRMLKDDPQAQDLFDRMLPWLPLSRLPGAEAFAANHCRQNSCTAHAPDETGAP